MSHNDKEAAELWCPMVRVMCDHFHAGNAGTNKEFRNPAPARCIGSQCAMWRTVPLATLPQEQRGYCGLAGRP